MTLGQFLSKLTNIITATVIDGEDKVIVFNTDGYEALKTEISERIVESWEIVKSTEIVVTLAGIQP